MKTAIIKVGSSKGIILPKHILAEMSLVEGDKLNLKVEDGVLSLTKVSFLDEVEAYFKKHGPMTETAICQDIPDSTLSSWTWG